MSVEKLIRVLHAIDEDDSIGAKPYLTDGPDDERSNLVQQAVSLADQELITSLGGNNYGAHAALEAAGFRVFCGEKDGSGWLSGCIQTNKGVIVYG